MMTNAKGGGEPIEYITVVILCILVTQLSTTGSVVFGVAGLFVCFSSAHLF